MTPEDGMPSLAADDMARWEIKLVLDSDAVNIWDYLSDILDK
jgi:hypothetical protein